MAAIFFASFLVCFAIIGVLLKTKLAWRIATDVPNGRSLHHAPIPRIGGWGVVPAALAVVVAFGSRDPVLPALAAVLFAVSYCDDRLTLPIAIRLPAHAAAAVAWLMLGPVDLPVVTAALAAFAIVWVTNLFNFMDGADGLAGGMALFAFAAYAFVAASAGVGPLAWWSIAIAGSAAAFLVFNFNPARVFLGDAGSICLGFLAGVFGIWGWAADAWPVWFPFLVSAPFFLDATVTILRRMVSREPFWRAHREHYYQRLIRSGWSHRRTALCEYALMAGSAGLAVLMLGWSPAAQYGGLAAVAVVYVLLAWVIDRRWAEFVEQGRQGSAEPRSGISARHPKAALPRTGAQQEGFLGEAVQPEHRRTPVAVNVLSARNRERASSARRSYPHDTGKQ